MVIEAEVFPAAVACLRDPDEYVRKNVTTLMREVVKHTPEVQHYTRTHRLVGTVICGRTQSNVSVCSQLSQVIVNCGGLAAVIDYLGNCHGNLRLPGIMMLGYVAAHSENLAMAVILSKVCVCVCSSSRHVTAKPPINPETFLQVQYVGHINSTRTVVLCVLLSCRGCPSCPCVCLRSPNITSRLPQPGPSVR